MCFLYNKLSLGDNKTLELWKFNSLTAPSQSIPSIKELMHNQSKEAESVMALISIKYHHFPSLAWWTTIWTHRWICPFLWRYSSPSRTSLRMVAMLASSNTPVLCSPREMICLMISNTEPVREAEDCHTEGSCCSVSSWRQTDWHLSSVGCFKFWRAPWQLNSHTKTGFFEMKQELWQGKSSYS